MNMKQAKLLPEGQEVTILCEGKNLYLVVPHGMVEPYPLWVEKERIEKC